MTCCVSDTDGLNGVEVSVRAEVKAAVTRLTTDCGVYLRGHLPSLHQNNFKMKHVC